MHAYIHYLHIFSISLFTFYILIDRAYIRNFVVKDTRERFYLKARVPLVINILMIIITGIFLLMDVVFSIIIFLKVLFAIVLFYVFFNCPFYMKKQTCERRKFMYRFGVLILLVLTIVMGFYI